LPILHEHRRIQRFVWTRKKRAAMRYVKMTRTIEADAGKGSLKIGPAAGFTWELLEVVKHDHNESEVAYLRSNPDGVVYVTDELDALIDA
jgi:hypothetical protein